MKRTLTIDYSDEILLALGCSPEQFSEEAKLLVTIKLYELGRLFLGSGIQAGRYSQAIVLDEISRLRRRCLPTDRGRPPTGLGQCPPSSVILTGFGRSETLR